ncbi:MAG: efflux RND transporter periplasmic adaptor subunit [Acidobacteriota bacterium]|nr:efflux RND transporter periplasmic adaptor subunit [Acidobacteriota bacterium]MDH3523275.1 efflux RND transporter periplasmic adaptor subunit [Acidobacteriota bacterium]
MSAQRRFSRKRVLAWGLPAAVVVLLIALALRPQQLDVDMAEVTRGDLVVAIEEEGQTRVRERFVVSAPLAGKLLRVELEPGDPVVAGETVLATFLPQAPTLLDARSRAEAEARIRSAQAILEQAKAEQKRADAELSFGASELARRQRLAAANVISEELLEEAELTAASREQAAKAAGYAVESAQFELARARAALGAGAGQVSEPIEIHSPVDGSVLRRLHESEAIVAAGEPLIEVGDAALLEIVSDLLSSDAVRVRPGQRVVIEQWGGDRPLNGAVRRVEPYGFTKISALGVEEQRVNVVIDITDPHDVWSTLGDGYRVEVAIVVSETEDVLVVPTSSLFRQGDGWAVWAVEQGRAVRREVEVGARNGLEAEVSGGLGEGDRVIVHPSDAVGEGARVRPRGP